MMLTQESLGCSHVVRSDVNPSNSLYGLAMETKKMLLEKHPSTLIIGTHPTMPESIGSRILLPDEFPCDKKMEIVGSPGDVVTQIQQLSRRLAHRFAIVLCAYESHHVHTQDLPLLLEGMKALSHGTVIMADYTVAGISSAEVCTMAEQKIDKRQLALFGGSEEWTRGHRTYDEDSFFEAMTSTDWAAGTKFRMDRFNAGFVGSDVFSSTELQTICENSFCTMQFLRTLMR